MDTFTVGDVVKVNKNFGSDVDGIVFPDKKEVGEFAVITAVEIGGYCIRMNKTGREYFVSSEMLDAVEIVHPVRKAIGQLRECGHPYASTVMDARTGETSCGDCGCAI